ncbi:DUF397 domain-containing protein [Streptomyces sp. NPDC007875]|uniref:DUF397 domain-containing protein n=1 Tax=Streptomyces sp. NPDC007875 TaxID=3364783 RepID=UPI0036C652E1
MSRGRTPRRGRRPGGRPPGRHLAKAASAVVFSNAVGRPGSGQADGTRAHREAGAAHRARSTGPRAAAPPPRGPATAGPSNGDCLEIARGYADVPVRDSKTPRGPALVFEPSAWSASVSAVKRGELPTI